ncbi:MAG: (d)CMP kinase [Puniceicoccales bacterium]|jgi:cytidylate kinase|nr:(d)CMP kinase [Puniceicoccales bacterium]
MATPAFITIAVDGGAASGKSTTCRNLAKRFHLLHVDTGSHYRTITLALLRANIAPDDTAAIEVALNPSAADTSITTGTLLCGNSARLTINGTAPDAADLRSPAVNAAVSPFAAVPAVRHFLFAYQRSQVATARTHGFHGLIMEGRDIGSVILPDAHLRIFLEADPAARAARRAAEGGIDSIVTRDQTDSSRSTAPLLCPPGAIRIDNTHVPLASVVDQIAALIDAARAAL